jgi:hypothetical protein
VTLTDAIFGQITGHPAVEFAVLDTLEAWVPYMLRVIERREGFPPRTLTSPPGRGSYKGGLDFESWEEEDLPTVIAVVQPEGDAQRSVEGYSQFFSVEVGVIVQTESEDESRALAGHLGTAVMVTLAQHGDLGGLASFTRLTSAPVLDFPDPEQRTFIRARIAFRSLVTGLVDDLAGPRTATPPESPHFPPDDPEGPFGDWATRTVTNVQVDVVTEIN